MKLIDIAAKSRSCRAFDESRKISADELRALINMARLSPTANNRQPLKFFLSADEKTNAVIQPLTGWAGALPQLKLPPEGHRPTAFIVICVDKRIAPEAARAAKDVGIAAQTIMLGACEMGLAGCMIGSFKPPLHDALGLSDDLEISLVLALGKGIEDIRIVDAGDSVTYYRDENNTHFVPKRTVDELIVGGGK